MKPFEPVNPPDTFREISMGIISGHAADRARDNMAKWGCQSPVVLLACMTEELGEVAREVLQGSPAFARGEIIDLMALCYQILESIERDDD